MYRIKTMCSLACLTFTAQAVQATQPKVSETRSTKLPNILMILVDDLGKEWLEPFGSNSMLTPAINSLAEQGTVYTNAYSMPQSTPSRVALLTGQYPYHNGWINHYDVPRWGHGVNFDSSLNPCYPQILKKLGYHTCIAGKWQINDFRLEPDALEKAGFDSYCMWTGAEKDNEKVSDSRYWDPYIYTKEGSKVYKGLFGPDIYSDFIVSFMKEHRHEPMFIYYPMTLTHTPFVATPLNREAKTRNERHRAMVAYTDYIVKKLMTTLDDLDLRKDTYIIFTTDNGTTSAVVGERNHEYIRGGKTYLSQNGINAPMITICPQSEKHHVSDALIDFTDIYPTVLDLAGIKNTDSRIDGHSFADIIRGTTNIGKRQYALSMGGLCATIGTDDRVHNFCSFRERAIIGQRYKLYLTRAREVSRIYDLINDPFEKENLIDNQELLSKVIASFQEEINNQPVKDNDPIYHKIIPTIYNEPAEHLNRMSQGAKKRHKDFLGVSTQKEYLEFIHSEN